MPFTRKEVADYVELINAALDAIDVKVLGDFDKAASGLKSLLITQINQSLSDEISAQINGLLSDEMNAQIKELLPEYLKDSLDSIKKYLENPTWYVDEKRTKDFLQLMTSRIRSKINEFSNMNDAQKIEYIARRNEKIKKALENKAFMDNKSRERTNKILDKEMPPRLQEQVPLEEFPDPVDYSLMPIHAYSINYSSRQALHQALKDGVFTRDDIFRKNSQYLSELARPELLQALRNKVIKFEDISEKSPDFLSQLSYHPELLQALRDKVIKFEDISGKSPDFIYGLARSELLQALRDNVLTFRDIPKKHDLEVLGLTPELLQAARDKIFKFSDIPKAHAFFLSRLGHPEILQALRDKIFTLSDISSQDKAFLSELSRPEILQALRNKIFTFSDISFKNSSFLKRLARSEILQALRDKVLTFSDISQKDDAFLEELVRSEILQALRDKVFPFSALSNWRGIDLHYLTPELLKAVKDTNLTLSDIQTKNLPHLASPTILQAVNEGLFTFSDIHRKKIAYLSQLARPEILQALRDEVFSIEDISDLSGDDLINIARRDLLESMKEGLLSIQEIKKMKSTKEINQAIEDVRVYSSSFKELRESLSSITDEKIKQKTEKFLDEILKSKNEIPPSKIKEAIEKTYSVVVTKKITVSDYKKFIEKELDTSFKGIKALRNIVLSIAALIESANFTKSAKIIVSASSTLFGNKRVGEAMNKIVDLDNSKPKQSN